MDFFITLEIVFWLYLVLGPALPSMGQAEEYYTYRDSAGKLVIKQQSLSDLAESENPQVQAGSTTQPNGNTPNSKPSNNK